MSLTAFVFVLFINAIKESSYIGREYQYSNTISVKGSGDISAISDIATLNVNISKDAITAKEAQSQLNESITKTLSYLKEQGIEDKDIKSEFGGINPKYETVKCYYYPCPSESKIVGYTANQSIEVKVRDVDNASVIRTGLSEVGITNISGPTFSIDDEDSYKAEARALAIKDAKEKAKILANDLGVKLGRIVSFYEEGENGYPMYAKEMSSIGADMLDSRAPAPVLPKGENKIYSNITITFVIK
jgi:hypothetical protein